MSPVVAGPRNFNNDHVSWQRFHLVVLAHVRQLPTLKGFICELSNAENVAPTPGHRHIDIHKPHTHPKQTAG